MQMNKIIVTGGSGFIGSNLVNFLVKKNFFVINLDKLTYSSNKYKSTLLNSKNYKLIKVDIANKKKTLSPIMIKGKFLPRLILPLSLSYDHRVIDGVGGIQFTTALKGLLESPDLFLDEEVKNG